jgi:hypothetical protein
VDPQTESGVEIALRAAAEKLEKLGNDATRKDLNDAVGVLERAQKHEGRMSEQDLMAFKDLREVILQASAAFKEKRTVPSSGHGSAASGQESPSKVELLLRATTAKLESKPKNSRDDVSAAIDVLEACDGISAQMSTEDLKAYKDLQDAILRASSNLTNSPAKSEPASSPSGRAAAGSQVEPSDMAKSMLVQMLNKLRSGRLSDEQLAPMSAFLERFKAMKPQGKLLQAVEVIENLISRQREQNEDEDCDEGIPGGYINELTLIPRIVERLREKDFVAETTLFEIQCISKILMHLSNSSVVERNKELQTVVAQAKIMFSEHVSSYEGSAKDPSTVVCPLMVTGQVVEDSAEESTCAFTLISQEESEEYSVSEDFVNKRLLADPTVLGPCSEDLQTEWDGKSAAILFCITQYPEGNENTTALSELMVLHDVLDKRFGFDLVSIADPNATAESLLRVVEDVVNTKPSRLLVYFHTPRPSCIAPTPHALTFADGSALPFDKIFAMTATVPRVVCVHDSSRQLEVVASLTGKRSPSLSVSLTEAAAAVANTSRCWLYDGVFTPIVVELLSKDNVAVLCPEDIATYTAAALLGKSPVLYGPRSGDEVLSMVFLAPFEDGTEEPLEE